jgi:hypothetical protein
MGRKTSTDHVECLTKVVTLMTIHMMFQQAASISPNHDRWAFFFGRQRLMADRLIESPDRCWA